MWLLYETVAETCAFTSTCTCTCTCTLTLRLQTSGALLASWPGRHKGRVYKLVELSLAALVVSASEDMTVNVWSAASMSFVCAIRGDAQHSVMMRAMLAVRHDESTQAAAEQLWTSDATGKINVWELSTQTTAPSLVQSTSLTGGESICCMCQAPDTGMRSCRFEDVFSNH